MKDILLICVIDYVEQDDTQAAFWYRKAAEQNYPTAQCNLGRMYVKKKNYSQALSCYLKAAEQNNIADAQYNLGRMYFIGQGVKQDDTLAVFWYRKAAKQSHTRSQSALGFMYAKGLGVKQDHQQAVFWHRKAAEKGHIVSQQYLMENITPTLKMY